MAMTVHVDVVSIEASIFSGLAECIVAPAEMGEIGIYPGHAPMLTRLKAGVVRLKLPQQSQEHVVYVSGGMLEVLPGGVTILSDLAIRGKDVEEGKLEDEKRKTEEAARNRLTALEYARLEAELARALRYAPGIEGIRHGGKGL